MKGALLSVLTAVASAVAFLFCGGVLFTALQAKIIAVVAASAVSIGVSLWRPIRPVLYGTTLAAAMILSPIVVTAITGATNLSGLLVFFTAAWGLVTGGSAALFGSWIRTRRFPQSAATGIVIAGATVLIISLGLPRYRQIDERTQLLFAIQDIRRAELAYAAARADHAFTCNGPDLKGFETGDWRKDPQMAEVGVEDLSQIHKAGSLIYLRCDPSSRRRWVDIAVMGDVGVSAHLGPPVLGR